MLDCQGRDAVPSPEMTGPSDETPYEGLFGPLRKIDQLIFTVEMAILWTFLAVSAAMVFLDVAYRRLAAPDSKVGELFGRVFGIEDPAKLEALSRWGPIVSAAVGFGLLWFAFWTAERHKSATGQASKSKPLLQAVLVGAGLSLLGWIMTRPEVPSKYFYLVLYVLCGAAWLRHLLRVRGPHWKVQLLAFLLSSGLFIFVALNYFPDGYSWSKELSLIMLLWVGFLGASVCAHEGKHIQMGALKRLVPEGARAYVEALGYLLTAAFCLFMVLLGYEYAKQAISLEGRFEQTNVPDWIATIAVPAAFLMTMLRYIAAAVSALLGGSYGASEDETEVAAKLAAEKEAKS